MTPKHEKGRRKKKFWQIWVSILAISLCYACCHTSLTHRGKDATHLKRNAFAKVSIKYKLSAGDCLSNPDVCTKNPAPTAPYTVGIQGSSVIVGHYRGDTYLATVEHICGYAPPTQGNFGNARYIIKTQKEIKLFDLSGSSHIAEVVYMDTDNDICILKSEGNWGMPVELANKMPQPGEKVFNMAAPYGIFFPETVILLDGYYSGPGSLHNEVYTIHAKPGSSGSPIFNSDGELIGLIHSSFRGFEALSLGCKLINLKGVINAHVPSGLLRRYDNPY